MIRRPPRSTLSSSSAASDVYKRQVSTQSTGNTHRRNMCTNTTHQSNCHCSDLLKALTGPGGTHDPVRAGHKREWEAYLKCTCPHELVSSSTELPSSTHPLEEELGITPKQVREMSDEDILAALVEDLERVESQHQPGLVSNSCRYHVRCPEVVNQDHHGCRFHEECEANDPVGQLKAPSRWEPGHC
eukprot:TRINITY_DN13056_c0_g1_i3.p1 TRINITY_DN13056_c0_g1~~TRINITY_DN13056_c0_g1_i3.p1  ORF type:complete len:187 (-),score=35.99 TRINITY_DN13056_c0_g1_i3:354-914(-)